jgi:hypothetical protein
MDMVVDGWRSTQSVLGVLLMTTSLYGAYLSELAKRKSWKPDALVEEQRRQLELEIAKENKFYVYVYRDPRSDKNLCPIWVGKGFGRRAFAHLDASAHTARTGALRHIIAKCRKLGLTIPVEIVGYFETEEAAFEQEAELIAKYGRRNLGTGTLCNLTDGGEGTSGWLPSEDWREKLSAHLKKLHKKHPKWGERLRMGIITWFENETNMQAHSARMKAEMTKPERLAQIAALAKQNNNDPDFCMLRAKTLRKNNAKNKAKNIARLLIFNADPAHQANTQAKRRIWIDKPEIRQAMRDIYKTNKTAILRGVADYWNNPKSRIKQAERMRALNLRSSEEYKRTHIHTCKTCGKDFKPGAPQAQFCSETCRVKARNVRRRVPWQTKRKCKECGETFMPKAAKAEFCCRACYIRHRRRNAT